MRHLTFYCFFDNISDYLKGYDYAGLSFGLRAIITRDWILLESIECAETIIKVPNNAILYGFSIIIKAENPDEIDPPPLREIKEQPIFKNAIICNSNDIDIQRDNHGRLPQGKYFDESGHIGLVQYAFNHNYFTLDDVSGLQKEIVEKILNIDITEVIEYHRLAKKLW